MLAQFHAATEAACRERCAAAGNCSVYNFKPFKSRFLEFRECRKPGCTKAEPAFLTANCWLCAPRAVAERLAGEACTAIAANFVVGARCPPSPREPQNRGSCSGRCGEASGAAACYCDGACARHLDCCADFVQQCTPPEAQWPSCQGRCPDSSLERQIVAVPVWGGGYCRCDSLCDVDQAGDYTDNNSFSGCCADFDYVCRQGPQDPMCLDARTQAQAVQLLVALNAVERLAESQSVAAPT